MRVNFNPKKRIVTVKREKGEKKIYKETEFYHKLKKKLQGMGYDVIKKLMQKDGHLYGDGYQYYIRERKWKWAIYDGNYALRMIYENFNKEGEVNLICENWEKE